MSSCRRRRFVFADPCDSSRYRAVFQHARILKWSLLAIRRTIPRIAARTDTNHVYQFIGPIMAGARAKHDKEMLHRHR
jgi:hypothetical protein